MKSHDFTFLLPQDDPDSTGCVASVDSLWDRRANSWKRWNRRFSTVLLASKTRWLQPISALDLALSIAILTLSFSGACRSVSPCLHLSASAIDLSPSQVFIEALFWFPSLKMRDVEVKELRSRQRDRETTRRKKEEGKRRGLE